MIDLYRFVLAACVVQAHVMVGAWAPLSQQAVFSFYVLSGFLMTLVLDRTYGFGPANFGRFWANRALRLYPVYLVVILLTVLHIAFVGPFDQIIHELGLPRSGGDAAANVAIWGLATLDFATRPKITLVPNAWSLAVEMFSYLLLSLYFARTEMRAFTLLVIGTAITTVSVIQVARLGIPHLDFQNHYGVVQAGIMPFAAGSLAYFHRDSRLFAPTPARIAAILILWAANAVFAQVNEFHRFASGLYVSVLLNAFLVPMLFRFDGAHRKAAWHKLLGGASYPLFLSHILIGTLLFEYVDPFPRRGFAFFVLTLAVATAFSVAVHLGIERNVEGLRKRIKRRIAPAGAVSPAE